MATQDPSALADPPPTVPSTEGTAEAPPVVAVVVTHDAGEWLEEALGGLAAQDYPNLSVLVIDAGSEADPVGRVASVLPAAYVRRLGANPGFAAAANEVLEIVEGAAFYAFCHDDVLLEPDAIRTLVEEAYRSNAGVVGPKLVSWGAPQHLLQVGLSADKTGVMAPIVERGELDQEQHDRVRDVFALPGGCLVVRADLFETLAGFDPAIEVLGEDLDLCWRAQVAGARVVVVPSARAQHREALSTRRPVDDRRRLLARHRLRTLLTCYGPFHLLRVLPQAALVALVEAVYAVAAGRSSQAADVLGAWSWNLRRLGEIRDRRHLVRRTRRLSDGEVRRLQVRGSARLSGFIRGELGGDRLRSSLADVGRELTGSLTSGPRKLVLAAWVLVALLVLVGTRHLLLQRLPVVGSLAPFEEGPLRLLQTYLSGWHDAGLGSESPAPTALALLGVAGLALLGGMGLLQQVLVLGAIPLGLAGAWRLTARLGSLRARAVGLVVYAVLPLPWDSLARGRWGGLLVYAAAPWVLGRLLAATGQEPFADDLPDVGEPPEADVAAGEGGSRPAGLPPGSPPASSRALRPLLPQVVGLGVVVALLSAFVPVMVLLVPLVAVALAVGALLTADTAGSARVVGVAVGASLVAALLHVPWTFDVVLPGSDWSMIGGVVPLGTEPLGIGELIRFETGPVGVSALGWSIPVAAALALLIGRSWRFAWSARLWLVAIAGWALALAGARDVLPLALPPADVLLAPGGAALALAAALGMAAFERDLRGFRFGPRQVASLVAAAAVGVAVLPVAASAVGGRWGLPELDFAQTLSFLDEPEATADGASRVLWIGHPAVLPVGGHRLEDDLAYALSRDGSPSVPARWAGSAEGATGLVGDALRLAAAGETERLGRLLAPFGVRYIALVERAAPARTGALHRPLPGGVATTVSRQLDLRRIELDPALTFYENTAWAPIRAALPGEARGSLESSRLFEAAARLELGAARPVLPDRDGYVRWSGEVPAGEVYVAEAASSGWELRVDGETAPRGRGLGWANAFTVEEGGEATLRYRTSPARWLAVAVQVALWAGAVWLLLWSRRSRAGAAREDAA